MGKKWDPDLSLWRRGKKADIALKCLFVVIASLKLSVSFQKMVLFPTFLFLS